MKYQNLDTVAAYKKLKKIETPLVKKLLNKERIKDYQVQAGSTLSYHFAAMPVSDDHLVVLQELSDEMSLIQKYEAILDGQRMNTGENRLVLHHLSRGQIKKDVIADGQNKGEFYRKQLSRIETFSNAVRNGEIVGSTGKSFSTVVQIGIGGSDLGPRALYLALKG